MNVFRLTKRSLASSTLFAKANINNKSFAWGRFFSSFFSKKGYIFQIVFGKFVQIQTSWREDLKPQLLSFWGFIRIKVAPTLWFVRETTEILVTHFKAIILPYLWHFRYMITMFFARLSVSLRRFLKDMGSKIKNFIALGNAITFPFWYRIRMRIIHRTKTIRPVLLLMNNTIAGFLTFTQTKLIPVLKPINKQTYMLTTYTKQRLAPILAPINNKLVVFTPSVKKHFERGKGSFFSFFAATWQLSRKESLTTNMISITIVVFCTVVYIKRKEQALQNQVKYGFSFKDFNVVENQVKKGEAVYSMLVKSGLTNHQADSLLTVIKPNYDFEKIQIGKPYTLLMSKAAQKGASYLVFETDSKRYFVFNLVTPSVKEVKHEVSVREFQTSGKLHKTLYSSLVEKGMSYGLINMVQEALKNKMDIKQCANGDEYKLIWEEELVNGRSVGAKKLTSVYIKGQCIPKPIYAFYYNNGVAKGWYEKDGLPVRDGFIDSPVVKSTITSRFNPYRKHPVLGYRRPHLGTDYAAPRGTPIVSVADGVVQEAKYGVGNGRYVKIKHKQPYETQYLHMSRFAKGIEAGKPVKKKQVIGYVGMSGLTTGPHVCFRLWKQGIAIDHLAERFFTETDSIRFKKLVMEKIAQLDKIVVLTDKQREKQKLSLMELIRF